MKSIISITIDTDLLLEAKSRKLNISGTFNDILKSLLEDNPANYNDKSELKKELEKSKIKYDMLKDKYESYQKDQEKKRGVISREVIAIG